jgi:hypothetical protein
MPKLLTRLRIDEVSAVDRGAGDGVKIVLIKRDDTPRSKPHVERHARRLRKFQDIFMKQLDDREYSLETGATYARTRRPPDDDVSLMMTTATRSPAMTAAATPITPSLSSPRFWLRAASFPTTRRRSITC